MINLIDFQAHMNCSDIQLMSISVSQKDGVRGIPRKKMPDGMLSHSPQAQQRRGTDHFPSPDNVALDKRGCIQIGGRER